MIQKVQARLQEKMNSARNRGDHLEYIRLSDVRFFIVQWINNIEDIEDDLRDWRYSDSIHKKKTVN